MPCFMVAIILYLKKMIQSADIAALQNVTVLCGIILVISFIFKTR